MNYTEYAYLWPPRPETKIAIPMLSFYEKQGYWAQVKKNGTCTVIFCRGHEVIFKTRHDDDHKAWSPKPSHIKFFQRDNPQWDVYVAELLHSKTPHIKDQLYIFDKIVENGVHLVGTTFAERQINLLSQWTGDNEIDQLRVDEHVSVALNFDSGFKQLYDTLKPEDEGLVLKDPNAKLRACLKPDSNAGWQVKCRIATKNYGF